MFYTFFIVLYASYKVQGDKEYVMVLSIIIFCPDPSADPKSRYTVGFHIYTIEVLASRSWGFHLLDPLGSLGLRSDNDKGPKLDRTSFYRGKGKGKAKRRDSQSRYHSSPKLVFSVHVVGASLPALLNGSHPVGLESTQ